MGQRIINHTTFSSSYDLSDHLPLTGERRDAILSIEDSASIQRLLLDVRTICSEQFTCFACTNAPLTIVRFSVEIILPCIVKLR